MGIQLSLVQQSTWQSCRETFLSLSETFKSSHASPPPLLFVQTYLHACSFCLRSISSPHLQCLILLASFLSPFLSPCPSYILATHTTPPFSMAPTLGEMLERERGAIQRSRREEREAVHTQEDHVKCLLTNYRHVTRSPNSAHAKTRLAIISACCRISWQCITNVNPDTAKGHKHPKGAVGDPGLPGIEEPKELESARCRTWASKGLVRSCRIIQRWRGGNRWLCDNANSTISVSSSCSAPPASRGPFRGRASSWPALPLPVSLKRTRRAELDFRSFGAGEAGPRGAAVSVGDPPPRSAGSGGHGSTGAAPRWSPPTFCSTKTSAAFVQRTGAIAHSSRRTGRWRVNSPGAGAGSRPAPEGGAVPRPAGAGGPGRGGRPTSPCTAASAQRQTGHWHRGLWPTPFSALSSEGPSSASAAPAHPHSAQSHPPTNRIPRGFITFSRPCFTPQDPRRLSCILAMFVG
jgi:hypothetical protein